ncbi:hypothetical protein BAOM_2436 [Peribacillus asahii]|uniref:Uncharacterized protein n=1 Tax=Peribacillus asahii TaxID=228899 RepID=A0A3T0KS11_9BACI|nr:hypothetical protein BAOM_2436 [Peribacillus asahii]
MNKKTILHIEESRPIVEDQRLLQLARIYLTLAPVNGITFLSCGETFPASQ